jgi:serine/threonine protein kinase
MDDISFLLAGRYEISSIVVEHCKGQSPKSEPRFILFSSSIIDPILLSQRLQDEVLAWYRLQHPNIAQLFGVVQSSNSIAMISPWCTHGNICHYLKEVKPSADRLDLVRPQFLA